MIAPDPDLAGDLTLAAGAYVMRPLEAADAPELLAHFADPRVVEFMDIEPMTAIDEAEAVVAWARSQRAVGAGLRFSIRDTASAAFAGTCGFNRIVVERGRRGEIAYDLSPPWWGAGVMDAVLPVLIDFASSRLALHRLEALVTPGNAPSCRLLEGHGFTREGVLVGHGFWKGRFWDQIVYGRLLD